MLDSLTSTVVHSVQPGRAVLQQPPPPPPHLPLTSPSRAPLLHSTLAIFFPPPCIAPSPCLASPPLLPPPFFSYPLFSSLSLSLTTTTTTTTASFFFFPLVLSFLPFLLTSSLPPFIFCLSPLPLASFTSQSFHSVAVNRVSFPSSSPSLCLVHFTDVIGTSGSKLTGFGLETCSSSETNRYRRDNV